MSLIDDIQKQNIDSLEAAKVQLEGARNIIEANKLHDYKHQVRIAHAHILSGLALLSVEISQIERYRRDGD
jgi:hypothetical protein